MSAVKKRKAEKKCSDLLLQFQSLKLTHNKHKLTIKPNTVNTCCERQDDGHPADDVGPGEAPVQEAFAKESDRHSGVDGQSQQSQETWAQSRTNMKLHSWVLSAFRHIWLYTLCTLKVCNHVFHQQMVPKSDSQPCRWISTDSKSTSDVEKSNPNRWRNKTTE